MANKNSLTCNPEFAGTLDIPSCTRDLRAVIRGLHLLEQQSPPRPVHQDRARVRLRDGLAVPQPRHGHGGVAELHGEGGGRVLRRLHLVRKTPDEVDGRLYGKGRSST